MAHPVDSRTGLTKSTVISAINHLVGRATQALLNRWHKRELLDDGLLPADIKPILTALCDVSVAQFRHGRVVLASNLILLFRVDPCWAKKNLLPLFDWCPNTEEGAAVWEGFLRSARLHPPLLLALKTQFLSTAHHYMNLEEHGRRQFAHLLTHAALESIQGFATAEFQSAIADLPPEGLQQVADGLGYALGSAAEQRESYWKHRVQPFWEQVWPKSSTHFSINLTQPLVELCIAAGGEFPSALKAVLDWLKPVEHPHYLVEQLKTSEFCGKFPSEALALLNAIFDEGSWVPEDLKPCLDAIKKAAPNLSADFRYQTLLNYAKR